MEVASIRAPEASSKPARPSSVAVSHCSTGPMPLSSTSGTARSCAAASAGSGQARQWAGQNDAGEYVDSRSASAFVTPPPVQHVA